MRYWDRDRREWPEEECDFRNSDNIMVFTGDDGWVRIRLSTGRILEFGPRSRILGCDKHCGRAGSGGHTSNCCRYKQLGLLAFFGFAWDAKGTVTKNDFAWTNSSTDGRVTYLEEMYWGKYYPAGYDLNGLYEQFK